MYDNTTESFSKTPQKKNPKTQKSKKKSNVKSFTENDWKFQGFKV
jgi:hypothetical protein